MSIGEKQEKKRKEKKRERKKRLKALAAGQPVDGEGDGLVSDNEDADADADERNDLRVGGDDPYFQQDFGPDFRRPGNGTGGAVGAAAVPSDSDADANVGEDADSDADADGSGLVDTAALALIAAGGAIGDVDENGKHFDMRKIVKEHQLAKKGKKGKKFKKKGKKGKKGEDADTDDAVPAGGDEFSLDVDDDRFAAVFDNKDFSIDPTASSFVDTREMKRLIDVRQHRIKVGGSKAAEAGGDADADADGDGGASGGSGGAIATSSSTSTNGSFDPTIAALVRSVKMKAKHATKAKASAKAKISAKGKRSGKVTVKLKRSATGDSPASAKRHKKKKSSAIN
jgi:hypothetical protein